MTERRESLSGHWTGVYDYPDAQGEPVPFNARLEEDAGGLCGETVEPNTFAHSTVDSLLASLAGARVGAEVSFVKTYEQIPGAGHSVRYEGVVNADLTKIEGHWRVDGVLGWAGPFVMNRSDAGAAEEIAAEESVGIETRR